MFGMTVIHESTFFIVNFMKSYYSSSISNENLVFELGYVVRVKYKPDFADLIQKRKYNISMIIFILIMY